MNKLIITQNIVNMAKDKGLTMREAIEDTYVAEIADAKKENDRLKDFDGLSMVMYSNGLSKNSKAKDFYTTGENELLFPTIIDTRLAETVSMQPLIQLLVGSEQAIDGTSVKALTLDLTSSANKKALNLRDVVEGADLPTVQIRTGEKAISLYKRGVAVETTYEALRHTRLDMFMKTIEAIAGNVAKMQVTDIIKTLIMGDGNDNPITTKSSTNTPDKVSKKDILQLALDFYDESNGLLMDTIICSKALYLPINELITNTNEMQKYLSTAAFNFPQSMFSNINVIYDNNVTQSGGKEQLIGINKANAITKYTETGSIINEIDSNIRNQTKLGTISETVGFAKFINAASMALKFA